MKVVTMNNSTRTYHTHPHCEWYKVGVEHGKVVDVPQESLDALGFSECKTCSGERIIVPPMVGEIQWALDQSGFGNVNPELPAGDGWLPISELDVVAFLEFLLTKGFKVSKVYDATASARYVYDYEKWKEELLRLRDEEIRELVGE